MEIKKCRFQEKTVEAAIKHFIDHTRVLCADEAGLGKTIVARGIIEALADQRLKEFADEDLKNNCNTLNAWWKKFCEANSKFSSRKLFDLFEDYLKSFLPESDLKTYLYNQAGSRRNMAGCMNKIINGEKNINGEKIIRALDWSYYIKSSNTYMSAVKNLSKLIIDEHVKGKRYKDWEFRLPEEQGKAFLPAEPYRVLYVCSSLDIAKQNTARLVPNRQNSDRGKEKVKVKGEDKEYYDKPDRLSVLWYYLNNYPTPYLEIMPITATITTGNTVGSINEKRILNSIDKEDITAERKKGEEKTKDIYHPDLIIFDEFQNFSEIINIANNTPCNDKDLERIREFCGNYLSEHENTKILMLSATPFHTVDYDTKKQKDSEHTIALKDVVEFMGGAGAFGKYELLSSSKERADYLYNTCGIFRNERISLLGKDNTAYHMLCCNSAKLLPFAASLYGIGEGNCALRAIKTTPNLEKVPDTYKNNPGSYNMIEIRLDKQSHPRFERLFEVVTAREADDMDETFSRGLLRGVERINQLLWLPPICPRSQLGGIFAEYKDYSKTLVFSNLMVTPKSVCGLMNEMVTYKRAKLDGKELKDALEKHFSFPDKEIAELLAQYLNRFGGNVFDTVEKAVQYCIDGCLGDVIAEYYALVDEPKESLIKILRNKSNDNKKKDNEEEQYRFAHAGITAREAFNSPFFPFVLMTTSIGAEGLDFHLYCNRLAHYTKPSGVADLEQKNGRIDRRDSLAQRRFWQKGGNKFRMERYATQIENNTGGACPYWDAGEGNLHYYFFYLDYTSEKSELEELFQGQNKYREAIGSNKTLNPEQMNLSPFIRND